MSDRTEHALTLPPLPPKAGSGGRARLAALRDYMLIAILATINSKQKREIYFAGEPLDRKDFEKHVTENNQVHTQLFAKIGGAERGLESRLAARMDRIESESKESLHLMHQDLSAIGNDVDPRSHILTGSILIDRMTIAGE